MAVFKVVVRIFLGFVVLAFSRAAFLIAHFFGWYPEEQIASFVMVSPEAAGWITAFVIAAALWGFLDWLFYRRAQSTQSRPSENAIIDKSQLEIDCGEAGSFVEIPKYGLYGVTRQFQIRLQNKSRDKSVSDCKVQITDITPSSGYKLPRILKDSFSLPAGDQIYIPLASYGEAREPEKFACADTIIVIHDAKGGMDLPITEASRLTIRSTAHGTPYCEVECEIWVDSFGKFRIWKVDASNPKPTEPKVERDVWLSDAIWRAFLGKWGRPDRDLDGPGIGQAAAQRLHDIVVLQVRQWAYQNKLPIWGKRRGSTLWEPVPSDFWKNNRVNYLTILHDAPEKILVEQIDTAHRNDEWGELMTSKVKTEMLWPA